MSEKEIARFVFTQWNWFNHHGKMDNQFDKGITVGRMYAYADILQQITGRRNPKEWQEFIDTQ